MKKTTAFIFFMTLAYFSNAQSFHVGPKLGVNMSNYTGGNIKSDALFSYHVGGLMSFGLGNTFFIQPEALLS